MISTRTFNGPNIRYCFIRSYNLQFRFNENAAFINFVHSFLTQLCCFQCASPMQSDARSSMTVVVNHLCSPHHCIIAIAIVLPFIPLQCFLLYTLLLVQAAHLHVCAALDQPTRTLSFLPKNAFNRFFSFKM